MSNDKWTIVYMLNALLAQEENEKARELVDKNISLPPKSEADAIILRNSITLFPPEDALKNLENANDFFHQTGSTFRLATIDTNKGLVFLCQGELEDASRVLHRALNRMKSIGSREIFQSQFNLAIKFALSNDFDKAIGLLEDASHSVPAALLLDKVKIEMSISIFKLMSSKINTSEAIDHMRKLLPHIRGIKMPYLRKVIEHNIDTLSHNENYNTKNIEMFFANEGNTSLYMPIKYRDMTLVLLSSVHWRY